MDHRDLSALFIPQRVSDDDLGRAFAEVLGGASEVSVLLVEPDSGPAALRDHLDDYRGLSVWSAEALSWDDVAAALSVLVRAPLFSLTWCAESQVACWQTFHDGKAGPAHWEDDLALVKRGFARVYRATLPPALDLLTGLVDEASRGLRLAPGQPPAQLSAAMVRGILAGDAGSSCMMLGHHLGDLAFDPGDPAFVHAHAVDVGDEADVQDHELIGELMALVDSVPQVDLTVWQRVFVTDLARRVLITDKALTQGQRVRAAQLLRGTMQGSGSGTASTG